MLQGLVRTDPTVDLLPRQGKHSLAASLLLHACYVGVLLLPPGLFYVHKLQEQRQMKAVHLVLPPKNVASEAKKPPKPKPVTVPAVKAALPPPPPPKTVKKPKQGMWDIADDTTLEIPQVLSREEGSIGFGEPDDKYLSYVFRASDGTRENQDLVRRGTYWALEISEDGAWDLLERLRRQNRLSPGLVAYALFPPEMEDRVNQEIRRFYQEHHQQGQIVQVKMAFDASVPLGFRIVDLVVRTEP